ncbi:MAG: dihydrolipoyl dehydrogenase [Candidatus Omnitrophica bacterium]|nr:dihydrolipoyl dehydrogenase [Candidatus Omnitrophota bacterium]
MDYDLVIIGAGWAGFNAAQRAKELKLRVALVDKGPIGGTCLNLGCIPTKTLLQSAKTLSLAKKSAIFGVNVSNIEIDFARIQQRKADIINKLAQGMQGTLKGVDVINAEAKITSRTVVQAGNTELKTKAILIATGSKPQQLPAISFDHTKILSSDDILNLKEIPQSLLIIGGGVIGCEFACLFSALGTKVTIVEKMPQLLPGEDADVAKKLEVSLKKKGIVVATNTDASAYKFDDFALVLLSVGRLPNTSTIGLESVGVTINRNRIVVDNYLQTNVAGIFAAGDCTGTIMLAHYAAYQGRLCVHNIAKPLDPLKADNAVVPNCIFTDPEIASVGLKEETAKHLGISIEISKFDFLGSGMARIIEETDGFVKIITDKNSKKIIGASIIGPRATELIAGLAIAIQHKLTVSSLQETIFAHPTLSESIAEAFLNHGV